MGACSSKSPASPPPARSAASPTSSRRGKSPRNKGLRSMKDGKNSQKSSDVASVTDETAVEVIQPFAVDQLSYREAAESPNARKANAPKKPPSSRAQPAANQSNSNNSANAKSTPPRVPLSNVSATPGIRAKVAAAAAQRRASQDNSPQATLNGAVWTVPLGDANLGSKRGGKNRLSDDLSSSENLGLNSGNRSIAQKSTFLGDRNFESESKNAEFLMAISRDRMDQLKNQKVLVSSGKGSVRIDAASSAQFVDPSDDFEDDIQLVR